MQRIIVQNVTGCNKFKAFFASFSDMIYQTKQINDSTFKLKYRTNIRQPIPSMSKKDVEIDEMEKFRRAYR